MLLGLPAALRRHRLLLLPLVPLLALVLVLLASSAHVQGSLSRWTCRMSWMSPSYVHLAGVETDDSGRSSKWRLFLYREQGWDLDQRPSGRPVLYVPGNAGSYQQARSIASSGARQYWASPGVRDPFLAQRGLLPIDVFTVDFNEALSAFHGPTLLAQSTYVASCVAHILDAAYNHLPPDDRPISVILLGHSMGGIVARHAVTLLDDPNRVQTILTLSTPHQQAPVSTDSSLSTVYSAISTFFSLANQRDTLHPASNHLLVSICGGSPDPTLAADACALPATSFDAAGALGVFTSGMIGAWTGVDHEAMVWCHQVRWRVARILLEFGHEAVSSKAARLRIARDWLIGPGPPLPPALDAAEMKIVDVRSLKRTVLQSSTARIILDRSATSELVLFPLASPSSSGGAHRDELRTFRLLSNFAFGAVGLAQWPQAQLLQCSSASPTACAPLAFKALELLPPSVVEGTPWAVGEGIDEAEGMTWAEIRVGNAGWLGLKVEGGLGGWGVGEIGDWTASEVSVVKQGTFSSLLGFSLALDDGPAVLRRTFALPALLSHSLLVYRATFSGAQACEDPLFAPLMRHTTINVPPGVQPITHESVFYPSPSTALLHSHSASAPFLPPLIGQSQGGMSLEYWADPTTASHCGATRLRVRLDKRASMSRLVLRYRMTAVAWPVGVVAGVLALQARRFRADGIWPPLIEVFSQALRSHSASILGVLTAAQMWQAAVLRLPSVAATTSSAALASEALLGNRHAILLALPAVLALAAAGLVVVVLAALVGWIKAVATFGRMIDSRGWLLSLPRVDDLLSKMPRKRELVPVLVLLLAVATIIPYQGAVLILFLVHAIATLSAQLPSPSSTTVTSVPSTRPPSSPSPASVSRAATESRANLYTSILALLLWLLPANAPVLVVWVRDLLADWRSPFTGDHNTLRVVGVVSTVVACEGGRYLVADRRNHPAILLLEGSLFALSAFAFVFGSRYLYRMYDLANVALSVLAFLLWTAA